MEPLKVNNTLQIFGNSSQKIHSPKGAMVCKAINILSETNHIHIVSIVKWKANVYEMRSPTSILSPTIYFRRCEDNGCCQRQ